MIAYSYELIWVCTSCEFIVRESDLIDFNMPEPVVCGRCRSLVERHRGIVRRKKYRKSNVRLRASLS